MAYQNQAFAALPPIQITAGQDVSFDLKFASSDDLTGLTYEAELRTAPGATPVVTPTVDMTHATDTPPVVTFRIDSTVTDTMAPGEWVCDIWELDSGASTQVPIAFLRFVANAAVTEVTP